MAPREEISLWTIVREGHLYVFAYGGDGITQADGQAVIDTIKFEVNLPTP